MVLAGMRCGVVVLASLLALQLYYVNGGPKSCPSPEGYLAEKDAGRLHKQTRSQSLVQLSATQHEKTLEVRHMPRLQGIMRFIQTRLLARVPASSQLEEAVDVTLVRAGGGVCTKDADCGWHANCDKSDGGDGHCQALHLFAMPGADLLFGVLAFFVAGISLAAGVGGGGLFVPMLMVMLSFDARIATGLSQSMLLGGAVAAFAYNLSQSNPSAPSRPLIDFELACLLGPALMSGAQIGALVHAVAPPAVLLFLLCVVLFDAARKGVASALKIRAKELAAAEAAKLCEGLLTGQKGEEPAPEPAPAPRAQDPGTGSGGPGAGSSGSATEEPAAMSSEEAESLARVRGAQIRLVCLWLFTCTIIVAKGMFLDICSKQWWAVVAIAVTCLLGFALHFARELSMRPAASAESLDFTHLAFPLVRWSFFAGILAALCGIGGGMVMGPILVQLKVPPPVSSATTATTLLLISSSTALVYGCRGLVPLHYSCFLSLITACGAFTGKSVIGAWVKRTGRDSVIVWCLTGITVMSTALMGALGLYRVLLLGKSAFMFSSLCNADIPLHHLDGPTTGMKVHAA